jgi:hypothetical protein
MPDYRFTFTKQFDMIFEAQTEHEAWVQATTLLPDHVPGDWKIKLNEHTIDPTPLNQGPVEIDEWDIPDDYDRMS